MQFAGVRFQFNNGNLGIGAAAEVGENDDRYLKFFNSICHRLSETSFASSSFSKKMLEQEEEILKNCSLMIPPRLVEINVGGINKAH